MRLWKRRCPSWSHLVLLVAVVMASVASGDGIQAAPQEPMLTIVPGSGTFGTKFDITGSGWEPGEVVTVEGFGPDGTSVGPSQDYTADADGNIDPWN